MNSLKDYSKMTNEYSFKSNYKDLDGVNHIFESINKIAKLK